MGSHIAKTGYQTKNFLRNTRKTKFNVVYLPSIDSRHDNTDKSQDLSEIWTLFNIVKVYIKNTYGRT